MDERVASTDSFDGPHISKLNDLLSLIFMINTEHENRFIVTSNRPTSDDPEVQPLNTARHSSQVCQTWRNLILNSPTIWGSVIGLDLLRQKKEKWREEVMRRTGSATLCISGTIDWRKSRPRSFLTFLLQEHWERIQKLDIEMIGVPTNFPPTLVQDLRKRPAPSLEFIMICTPHMSGQMSPYYQVELCAGRVPDGNLWISCPSMPEHLSAPWLPQLRSITIGWRRMGLESTFVFQLLEKMAVLETLKIEPMTELNMELIPRNPIALPNLNFIALRNHFQPCFLILKGITPSPRCVLQLTSYDRWPEMISQHCGDLPLLTNILKQYSTAYFGAGNITHLKIYLSDSHVSIDASVGLATSAQLFDFEVYPGTKLPFIIPSSLLSCIISPQLSSITFFQFELYECQKCQLLRNDFMDLISACRSVRVIQVTKKAIEVLHDLLLERPTLLPSLDVLSIKMNDSEQLRPEHMDYLGAILTFLTLRKEANLPVKVLDLTACDTDESENFLEYQDKSLKVKIRRRVEVCISKMGHGNTREYCQGCGIAQILDIQNMELDSTSGSRSKKIVSRTWDVICRHLAPPKKNPRRGPTLKWGTQRITY